MSRGRVDVLIVTALKDELDAVLDLEFMGKGRDAWMDARDQSGFPYHLREIPNDHGEMLCVAAAWSGEMGEAAAAVRAVGLITELEPVCLAMCGICAGWRGKVFLGDVIVADRVFSYESGKQVAGSGGQEAEFFHDITTYNLEATWKMDAAYFAQEFQRAPRVTKERPRSKEAQTNWLLYTLEAHEHQAGPAPIDHPERKSQCPDWSARIKALRKRGLIADTPGKLKLTEQGRIAVAEERLLDPDSENVDPSFRVHVAPIATGTAVREDAELFDRLSRHVRKVLGAEMEARAIGFAAEQLGRRRSIIVKAVSDYADHDKDDAFRPFACHASAAFLMAFLQKHLRPERSSRISNSRDEEPLALDPKEVGEEEKRHDEFLAHVERACVLRHPEGTRITRHEAPQPFWTFLEVAVAEGRFVRVFPVAAIDRPMTEEILQAFLEGIHADYQRRIPAVHSTLVHAGASASEELARKAHAQHVLLTSFGEYQGLFDFSSYLQRQTARLEADLVYPPALYVEQRARVSIGGQEAASTNDVLSTLREMLDSPHPRFALVLGDFGTGKTFLLHELARRMAREQAALVPVLIEMRSLQKHRSLKALIAQHFAAADVGRLEPDQFLYMLQEGRIALLFDGFDELALRVTYDQVMEHFGTLLEAAQGKAKVVVTSRTQHFLKDHDVKRELGERAAVLPGYRLIKLDRFSEEQVRLFLVKRLGSEIAADERMLLLRDVRDLLGLSENPRLLGFIADLDPGALRAARARSGQITSAKLYELLINRWLEGEHYRVNPSGAPKGLSIQQLQRGATELAMLLWGQTERSVDIKELPVGLFVAVKAQDELALEEGVIRHQLGSGSLLVRDEEGRFSFIHQSVLEWLVAEAAARLVCEEKDAEFLGRREMTDLMTDFFIDLGRPEVVRGWAEAKLQAVESSTTQKNALRVMRRLRERQVDHDVAPEFRGAKNLEGKDLRGEDLSGAELDGANLKGTNLSGVTLVKAHLAGAQLNRAKLTRANLERAVLQSADLAEADLSGARLLGADLRGVNLQGASLRATKLVGAQIDSDSLERSELFGVAMPNPESITPSLGLASPIRAVAFDPTGEFLATAHTNGKIQLWDSETGNALRVLDGHVDSVLVLAFSADGKMLASGSDDRNVILWSVERGVPLYILKGHDGPVRSVAFNPDGEMLASGSNDGNVNLWSVERAILMGTLHGHRGVVRSVAFSPNGSVLASGSDDQTIALWSVDKARVLRTLRQKEGAVQSVVFSPDGKMLASGADDGTAILWSVEQAKPIRIFQGHSDYVRTVAFSPDGSMLASGSDDRTVILWNVEQAKPLRVLQGHSDYVQSVAFSPDGRMLASGSEDRTAILWDMVQTKPQRTLQGRSDHVRSVAFSPDGSILASGFDAGTIVLWNVKQMETRHVLRDGNKGPLMCVALSPDGRRLASGSDDGSIVIWDLEQATLMHVLKRRKNSGLNSEVSLDAEQMEAAVRYSYKGSVLSVAFSPDGKMLASGFDDQSIVVWSVEQARPLRTLRGHTGSVISLAFSPDGRIVASGSDDRTVTLWSVGQGTALDTLRGHTGYVRSVAFSPDGKMLLSGSDDRTAILWSIERGVALHTFQAHREYIMSVAFSPDGRMLALGTDDGQVIVSSVEQPGSQRVLRGHTGSVRSLAFHANSMSLASAADDGVVNLWEASTGSHLATFLGQVSGWVAFRPTGRFKSGGDISGMFWHAIGLCRFEPDELDAYLSVPLRLPNSESLIPELW